VQAIKESAVVKAIEAKRVEQGASAMLVDDDGEDDGGKYWKRESVRCRRYLTKLSR